MRRPAKPRVFEITRFRQRRCRRFPEMLARPFARRLGIPPEFAELELQKGILIPRKQPEEDPIAELEGPAAAGVPELQEPAILRDRPHVLDAVLGIGCEAEQVATPDSVVLLLLDDRLGQLRFGDRCLLGGKRLRSQTARR